MTGAQQLHTPHQPIRSAKRERCLSLSLSQVTALLLTNCACTVTTRAACPCHSPVPQLPRSSAAGSNVHNLLIELQPSSTSEVKAGSTHAAARPLMPARETHGFMYGLPHQNQHSQMLHGNRAGGSDPPSRHPRRTDR
jgi:hypothetical protein